MVVNKKISLILFITFSLLMIPCWCENKTLKDNLFEFFDLLNSDVHADSAELYEGQMAGFGTGGGATLKNGVFNRKPITVTMPSINAGCGGIDLHFGSFSHINSEEMIDFFKKTASNAAGYAFLLGLQCASPQASSILTELQNTANFINSMNLNSCEAGALLVSSVWPKDTKAQEHICQTLSHQSNSISDWAATRHQCSGKDNVLKEASSNSGDAFIGEYNLAWEAIKKNDYLSSKPEIAELVMSVTGTIIARNELGSGVRYYVFPSKVTDEKFVRALFSGGTLDIYKCQTPSSMDPNDLLRKNDCLNISEEAINLEEKESWLGKIRDQMITIQERILADEPLNSSEKQLLLKTHLPVARIICALTAYHRGRCPVDLYRIAEIVAMDVLCKYLRECVDSVRFICAQLEPAQMDRTTFEQFENGLLHVEQKIKHYESKASKLLEEEFQIMQMMEIIEKKLAIELCI